MVELGVFTPVKASDGRKTYYTFSQRSQDDADQFFEQVLEDSIELIEEMGTADAAKIEDQAFD